MAKKVITIICETCEESFLVSKWDAKRGQKYCSKSCFGLASSRKKGTIEERFWSKVNKNGPIIPHVGTPCWTWTGFTNKPKKPDKDRPNGYGYFRIGKIIWMAHRFSYHMHYGEIPSGKLALHQCDNPACVRPDHLYAGTYLDNAIDREIRSRIIHPTGKNHGKYTKHITPSK